MKRLSRFALWLVRNKTTDGWDLNVTESADRALFRPVPIVLRPQPDVGDTDPAITNSLVTAMERMPRKVAAKARHDDSGPQMVIIEPDEPLNVLKPEQRALRELLAEAAVATDPVSLVAWKLGQPEIADMPDQAWLMYACTQLLGSGLKLNFVGDSVPETFAINEGFHDVEVYARQRESA